MPDNINIAVEKIWKDLLDRRGVGNELEACDADIQEEIKNFWRSVIREAILRQL
jgi:hypothetical protein